MNCNDIIELEILEDETNMELDVEFQGDIIRLGGGEFIETDPTVPNWAKQPEKPTYTASEVGALDSDSMTTILTPVFTKIDKLFENVASTNLKLKLSFFKTFNIKSDDGTLPAGQYYGISHTGNNIKCIKIGSQEMYNISKNTTYIGEGTYITTYKVKEITNNSFVDAGVFNAIGEIKYNYNWEENILYYFKISDKFDDLPTGTYLGIYYNDSDFDSDVLEFTPFTSDGKSRIFNFNTLEIYVNDLTGIPDWAKQPEKPTYTAEEVGALSKDDVANFGFVNAGTFNNMEELLAYRFENGKIYRFNASGDMNLHFPLGEYIAVYSYEYRPPREYKDLTCISCTAPIRVYINCSNGFSRIIPCENDFVYIGKFSDINDLADYYYENFPPYNAGTDKVAKFEITQPFKIDMNEDGTETNETAPTGNYICIYHHNDPWVLEFTNLIPNRRSYNIDLETRKSMVIKHTTDTIEDEGNYYEANTIEDALQEIGATLGDIDTALNDLHTYAQGLIGGATK